MWLRAPPTGRFAGRLGCPSQARLQTCRKSRNAANTRDVWRSKTPCARVCLRSASWNLFGRRFGSGSTLPPVSCVRRLLMTWGADAVELRRLWFCRRFLRRQCGTIHTQHTAHNTQHTLRHNTHNTQDATRRSQHVQAHAHTHTRNTQHATQDAQHTAHSTHFYSPQLSHTDQISDGSDQRWSPFC